MLESTRENVVVVWLNRDLRLHDNPALQAALAQAHRVVLTYIWAKEEEGQFQPGRASRWWLRNSLKSLEERVKASGAYICYRVGPSAVDQLLYVCGVVGARQVFFNSVYDPLSLVRDLELKQRLRDAGIGVRAFNGELLYEPWEVLDENGRPFTTFAEFWNKVAHGMAHPPAPPQYGEPAHIPTVVRTELTQLSLEDLKLESPCEMTANAHMGLQWRPGTPGGLRLLVEFLDNRLEDFDHDRAKVDRDSTSRLSPHIHFGEISIHVIYSEAIRRGPDIAAKRPGSTAVADFIQQIGYREYSRYLSYHFPFTHERSLLEHVRAVPWINCPMRFKAWRQGQTGYPIIDASMRQLWATGWMHNRARVFTASFLVKHLLLPWQWGLKHFWDMLVDADLECDALGWQYVAGCLRDAHPFEYMMDMEAESKRFDPDGSFVRRWVPELAAVPLGAIHQPWIAPAHVLAAAHVRLGDDYPFPIVTIAESRAALARANSIVQRCVARRSIDEPYRSPTIPVEIKLLEPEDEVDQKPCSVSHSAGLIAALPSRSPYASPVCLSQASSKALLPGPEGASKLRVELYEPSCVLPDISALISDRQYAAAGVSAPMSVASCGQDGKLFSGVVGSVACSAAMSTCTHGSYARSGAMHLAHSAWAASTDLSSSLGSGAGASQETSRDIVSGRAKYGGASKVWGAHKALTAGTVEERSRGSAEERFSFPHGSSSGMEVHGRERPSESVAACSWPRHVESAIRGRSTQPGDELPQKRLRAEAVDSIVVERDV